MPRRIVYRDVPVCSRRVRYPFPQPNVPPWWVRKRWPVPAPHIPPKPVYKHKRTKSAWFIPNVGAWWLKPRKPHKVPPTGYKHKRTKSAHFIPINPGFFGRQRRHKGPSPPVYKHKRSRSAHFIPGVSPAVSVYTPWKRRRHSIAPQVAVPNYRHKRCRSAHFIPGVAPSPATAAGRTKRSRREILLRDGVRVVTNSERIDWERAPELPVSRESGVPKAAPRRREASPKPRGEPSVKGGLLGAAAEGVHAPTPKPAAPTITARQVGQLFEQATGKRERKLAARARKLAEAAAREAELDDEEALLQIILASL